MNLTFQNAIEPQSIQDFLRQRGLNDDGFNTRAKILSYWESLDIPSCPGSGKTTLLVAKLELAVEKWNTEYSGICVLSHTNVAKEEIRKRLTSVQANILFGYPHFVGTIHEFFNKYLAVPWLKSHNIPIKIIDSEFTYKKCQDSIWVIGKENNTDCQIIRSFLAKNHKNYERLIKLNWKINELGEIILQESDDQYFDFQKTLKRWVTTKDYHTHEDMLAFSEKLLFQCKELSDYLSSRFPLVLIDEAQDTNENQSKLLKHIFNPEKCVIQRFGDEDQQIYDFGEENISDPFPNPSRTKNDLQLLETQRCSLPICVVANNFSCSGQKITSNINNGIPKPLPHIILFNEKTANLVIPKFGELVKNEIQPKTISTIKVVGQIGK